MTRRQRQALAFVAIMLASASLVAMVYAFVPFTGLKGVYFALLLTLAMFVIGGLVALLLSAAWQLAIRLESRLSAWENDRRIDKRWPFA